MTIVVVSPHLDDGVMSLGATMHALRARGVGVRVVTVFAGDPERTGRASYWDAKRDPTAATAFAQRRVEDTAAAAVLGIETAWLPYDDGAYVAPRVPDAIWEALEPHLADASAVLVPGWPVIHPDHRFVTLLTSERLPAATPLLVYAELPYASRPGIVLRALLKGRRAVVLEHALGAQVEWGRVALTAADRAAKRAAVAAYGQEVRSLGYRARVSNAYERLFRDELIGHAPTTVPPSRLGLTR